MYLHSCVHVAGILQPKKLMTAITDGYQEHSNPSLVKSSSPVNSLSSSVKNANFQIFSSLMSKVMCLCVFVQVYAIATDTYIC